MSISLYILDTVGTPLSLQSRVSYLLPSSCSLIQVFFSFCRGAEIATAVQPPTDLVTLVVSIHHLLFQLLLMSSLLIYYRSLHYGDWTLRLPLLSAPHFVYVVFSSWLHVGLSINITCAVSSDLENFCHSLLHLDIRCCHICFNSVLRSSQSPCDYYRSLINSACALSLNHEWSSHGSGTIDVASILHCVNVQNESQSYGLLVLASNGFKLRHFIRHL